MPTPPPPETAAPAAPYPGRAPSPHRFSSADLPLWAQGWVGGALGAALALTLGLGVVEHLALRSAARSASAMIAAVPAAPAPVPRMPAGSPARAPDAGTTTSRDTVARAAAARPADTRTAQRAATPPAAPPASPPPAAGATRTLRPVRPWASPRRPSRAQERALTRSVLRSARAMLDTALPAIPPLPGLASWVMPVGQYRITAEFGQSGSLWSEDHTGLDLAAPTGTPVVAVDAGTVTSAASAGAYGLKVEVTHADGTQTWYCHLSRIDVAVGDTVPRGGLLGAVGATGNVTGPHLHLEVRTPDGVPIDPYDVLLARGALG